MKAAGGVVMVERLEIDAVSSNEKDPYGQSGFSSITATIKTGDQNIISFLKTAGAEKREITVRCGGLEVRGKVSKFGGTATWFNAEMSAEVIRQVNRTPET